MNAPIHTTRSPGHPVGRHWLLTALTALLLLMGCPVVIAAGDDAGSDLPVLSLSVLQFGTAHWELDHLQYRGLDRANGFRLELLPVANLPASRLAVTAGSVNGAVADLLWTQFRYQAGASYLYLPFSSRIGEILVAETSDISTLADLPGKRIGVAGGPDSKGWVLLNRVAARHGIDLSASASVQFAAPPLLSQSLKRGQLDVIVTYWHFAARMQGEGGWRSAFSMAELLSELGLERQLPVLGYVFPEDWARQHADLIDRFAVALAGTKAELAREAGHWDRLRPLMGHPADGVFEALRRGFVQGVPGSQTDQRIADMKQLLILTGADPSQLMPDDLFYRWRP